MHTDNSNSPQQELIQDSELRKPMLGLLADLEQMLLSDGLDDRSVHRVRVGVKRLRAWWRLMRPMLPSPTDYKDADAQLRALAHSLAGRREQAILAELLPAARSAARNRHPAKIMTTETQAVLAAIRTAAKEVRTAILPGVCANRLQIIEQQREQKLRRYGNHARKHPHNIEQAHNWRRKAKYLQYQREFMGKLGLAADPVPQSQLRHLGEVLGEYHDRMLALKHTPRRKVLKCEARHYFRQARKAHRQLFAYEPPIR